MSVIEANAKAMSAALSAVASVIPARTPKPILQNVLFTFDPEAGASLVATDLEKEVRHRVIGVTGDAPAKLLLPPSTLAKILGGVRGESVWFEGKEDRIRVRADRQNFHVPYAEPDEFPTRDAVEPEAYAEIPARDLGIAIRRTVFATDVESTRYALGGCLFRREDDRLHVVATDGRRLARQVLDATFHGEGPAVDFTASILPVAGLKLAARVLDDDDPPARLYLIGKTGASSTAAVLVTQRAEVYMRLVEGRFPRYQDVFPGSVESLLHMRADELLWAFRQASIATSEESRGIDVRWSPDGLRLSSEAADRGSGDVEAVIASWDRGNPVEATYDHRYVSEALANLPPETVLAVELVGPKDATVLRTDCGWSYVVMPLTKER